MLVAGVAERDQAVQCGVPHVGVVATQVGGVRALGERGRERGDDRGDGRDHLGDVAVGQDETSVGTPDRGRRWRAYGSGSRATSLSAGSATGAAGGRGGGSGTRGHVGRQGPGDVGGAPGHPLEKASTGSPCLELAACGPVADDGSIPTRSRSIWCCVSMPACAWAMCASVLGGRLGRWARPLPLPRAQRAPGRVEHQEVAEGGRPRRWQAEPREGAMIDWSVILVAPVPALGLETVGEDSGELVGEHLAAHWRQPGVGAGRHQHRRRRPSCQVSAPKPDRPVRSQAASISG